MKGHQQILSLRRRGLKPAAIFLCDYAAKWAEWEIEANGLPGVYVADDEPSLADLRFVTGCQVHLHADNSTRAAAWVDRLLQDGAKSVIQLTEGEIYVWQA